MNDLQLKYKITINYELIIHHLYLIAKKHV